MINITTKKDRDPNAWKAEREPIFSIDGREYTIPVTVPMNISLEAVDVAARLGESDATRWLMVTMLEVEGWDALRKCQDLEPADLRAVQEIIRQKVFGPLEDEGKS